MSEKIVVAVLYGGRSSEHSVSCVSAGAVIEHLDPERYEVIPVGITTAGKWTLGDGDITALKISDRTMPSVDDSRPEIALSVNPQRKGHILALDGEKAGSTVAIVDVVFPVMHGTFAEDGTIQGLLELSSVAYVGPGVLASSVGMDKEFTKIVLSRAGLNVGPYEVLRDGQQDLDQTQRDRLGLPVFVKPARGGSSLGISKVADWGQLPAAIAAAREYDHKVLIEAQIVGREVECGVMERADGQIRASAVAEIIMPTEQQQLQDVGESFYDFETKYLDNSCDYGLPAEISAQARDTIQNQSVLAFRALECSGLSRVDFFLTDSGLIVNEINTFPGFTPASMYPKMWAQSQVSYTTLLDALIHSGIARHQA